GTTCAFFSTSSEAFFDAGIHRATTRITPTGIRPPFLKIFAFSGSLPAPSLLFLPTSVIPNIYYEVCYGRSPEGNSVGAEPPDRDLRGWSRGIQAGGGEYRESGAAAVVRAVFATACPVRFRITGRGAATWGRA